MNYSVFIERSAIKSLKKISEPFKSNITASIKQLRNDPRPHGSKKLTGREAWRIRIGDYRAIYEIDDSKSAILVVVVGHRRDIYNK